MEDLQADVQQIVKGERGRLTPQYATAAREEAERIAVRAMRKAEDISAEAIAGLITGNLDDGFDPRGCFVYLLWGNLVAMGAFPFMEASPRCDVCPRPTLPILADGLPSFQSCIDSNATREAATR